VPFLESCSVEDEDSDLISKWAALLVFAAQSEHSNLNWCIRILAEIDGHQARLLDSIYHSSRTDRHSDMYTRGLADGEFHGEMESFSRIKDDELEPALRTWDGYYFLLCEDDIPNTNELQLSGFGDGDSLLQLESLGLLWVFSSWVTGAKRYYLIRAFITPLGCSFVEACSEDKS
jgi:hypothetical protein